MRVATWNVERRTGAVAAKQDAVLAACAPTVGVLTEPAAHRSNASDGVVVSPAQRAGFHGDESWVAIVGHGAETIEPVPPYGRMSVAAKILVDDETVVVYGSVLPWLAISHHQPELMQRDETSSEIFSRILAEQVGDITALQQRFPRALVIWAGDFNQTLSGPNYGGRTSCRNELEAALASVGMRAWNRDEAHSSPGMCAIDLICGPKDRPPHTIERIAPTVNGTTLTDHAGYYADW